MIKQTFEAVILIPADDFTVGECTNDKLEKQVTFKGDSRAALIEVLTQLQDKIESALEEMLSK